MAFSKCKLFDICSALVILCATMTSEAASRPNFSLHPVQHHQQIQHLKRLNNFDIELLRTMTDTVSGNFMISPVSIKLVLGMILEGASGGSADELRRILRLPNDQEEIRKLYQHYKSAFENKTPGVLVEGANKVFVSNRYSIKPNYMSVLRNHYGASADSINFASTQNAANQINRWVSDSTHGQIQHLVDSGTFDADTVIILANALFFKGQWDVSFDEKQTKNDCFYVNQNCINVPMMELEHELKYAYIHDTIHAQVIDLDYKGGKYAMTIILPKEKNGLNTLVHDFSSPVFKDILSKLEITDMLLSMPKFNIDYEEDMTQVLKKMGVQSIFSKSANLTEMVDGGGVPQVDAVAHKTRIEVNEEGSIASAATGAMVVPLMGSDQVRMDINHPFIFLIRDIETEAILFAGRMEQPQPNQPQKQNQKVNQPPISKPQVVRTRPSQNQQPNYNVNYENVPSRNPIPQPATTTDFSKKS